MGYQTGGRDLYLDTKFGEITEEIIRYGTSNAVPIREYFNKLKEDYRSLKLLPCPGKVTQEVDRIPE